MDLWAVEVHDVEEDNSYSFQKRPTFDSKQAAVDQKLEFRKEEATQLAEGLKLKKVQFEVPVLLAKEGESKKKRKRRSCDRDSDDDSDDEAAEVLSSTEYVDATEWLRRDVAGKIDKTSKARFRIKGLKLELGNSHCSWDNLRNAGFCYASCLILATCSINKRQPTDDEMLTFILNEEETLVGNSYLCRIRIVKGKLNQRATLKELRKSM